MLVSVTLAKVQGHRGIGKVFFLNLAGVFSQYLRSDLIRSSWNFVWLLHETWAQPKWTLHQTLFHDWRVLKVLIDAFPVCGQQWQKHEHWLFLRNMKLCMHDDKFHGASIEVSAFMPRVSMTLTYFQGHSHVGKSNWKLYCLRAVSCDPTEQGFW